MEFLVQLLDLLQDDTVTLATLADAVHEFPQVALHVMRVSNTPVFEAGGPVETLDDAIERLGLAGLLKATSVFAVQGMRVSPLPGYSETGGRWLRRSLATAAIMEALAYEMSEDSVHAFLVGLFHNIGEIPISRLLSRIRPRIQSPDPIDFLELAKLEREVAHTDHSKAGGQLLQAWGVPEAISGPIVSHLHPMLSGRFRRFACMLHISRLVSPCLVYPEEWTVDCLAIPVRLLTICDLRKADLTASLPAAVARYKGLSGFYLEALASA